MYIGCVRVIYVSKVRVVLASQARGAYLEDCRLSQPTVEAGRDASGELREALWKATDEQLNAALAKLKL